MKHFKFYKTLFFIVCFIITFQFVCEASFVNKSTIIETIKKLEKDELDQIEIKNSDEKIEENQKEDQNFDFDSVLVPEDEFLKGGQGEEEEEGEKKEEEVREYYNIDFDEEVVLDRIYRDSDLRHFDTSIKSQKRYPWCTAFTTIAALENLANRNHKVTLDLSERHLWSNYKRYNVFASLKASTKVYIVDESIWPLNYSRSTRSTHDHGKAKVIKYQSVNLASIPEILEKGHPVAFWATTTRQWKNARYNGVIPVYGDVKYNRRGARMAHAILIVGYKYDERSGRGFLIFKNSWGTHWGDRGYGYLPFPEYCNRSDIKCGSFSVSKVYVKKDKKPSKNDKNENDQNVAFKDFRVKSFVRPSDYEEYMLFYLELSTNKQEILKKINKVEFYLHPSYGDKEVVTAYPSCQYGSCDLKVTTPYSYYTRKINWTTKKTVVHFQDGKSITLPGTIVNAANKDDNGFKDNKDRKEGDKFNVNDIEVVLEVQGYYQGQRVYRLKVTGKQATIDQIDKVEFHVSDKYRQPIVTVFEPTNGEFILPPHSTSRNGWKTKKTVLFLKSGDVITLNGTYIAFY